MNPLPSVAPGLESPDVGSSTHWRLIGRTRVLHLEVHPHEVLSYEEFQRVAGPAIALDGYVSGPTVIPPGLTHVTFNHHEGSARLTTRATCEQIALALHGRLARHWDNNALTVHINDADPDVCLAVWLLANPERVHESSVVRMVSAESWLDSTAGCMAPALEPAEAAGLSWVFAPCFALSPYAKAPVLAACVSEVAERIDAHLAGTGGTVTDPCDYKILSRHGPVVVVGEASPLARSRFLDDGIEVYVLVRARRGRHYYLSIGVTDIAVPYDLTSVYTALNAAEGLSGSECWSGADLVGGSPRSIGTLLDPKQVAALIACHLAAQADRSPSARIIDR